MTTPRLWLALIVILAFSACSINRLATKAIADVLSAEGASSFTDDDDPRLVGEALPFALKLYESLLAATPDHQGLRIATGSSFVMYAKAFVEAAAVTIENQDYQAARQERERAKRLYSRASRYLDAVVAEISPQLAAAITVKDQLAVDQALTAFKPGDERLLYWSAASIMAAFALDPFDFNLANRLSEAGLLMAKAYDLNPDYNDGAIDDFYISYYGSLPADLGGNPAKALQHFELAVKKSAGGAASPYVSAATALAIPQQDYEAFKRYLDAALAINLEANPKLRLANILAQDTARLLLARSGDYFLLDDDFNAYPDFSDFQDFNDFMLDYDFQNLMADQ